MKKVLWQINTGNSPIISTAIHNGHFIRKEIKDFLFLNEEDRLREEDPYVGLFTKYFDNRIVVYRSRFEIDLNRPREKAIYKTPKDAWGLQVYKTDLPKHLEEKSLLIYDLFYRLMSELFIYMKKRYRYFVVLDMHSYNYRRKGPDAPPEPDKFNPDINLGTKTIKNRKLWETLIEAVKEQLSKHEFFGKYLDVRENIKFYGGYFARWSHENFGPNVCVLSLEFKKIFMDEWTGEADFEKIEEISRLVKSLEPVILKELVSLGAKL
ncbi:N-formylglutamate amidohydrolase [Nitrosophilus alvini]|uniref:N-formylglutamate amidohydrolase n=1 Tax=Nitrosophilus alvini TaxID=2714855 RepID=UPI0019093E45|nr:N-formylglutamate amidohydrolase [Nitrosophilus alvini]